MEEVRPLVSVCIPTYNAEEFLLEALQSVLKQTYTNLEVIISDDASNDKTVQIANEFKTKAPFEVNIVNHNPQGMGANWNNCIQHAKGKYIKFLFQDDLLKPICIENMVAVLEHHPDIGLVACKREILVDSKMHSERSQQWMSKFDNLQKEFEGNEASDYCITKNLFSLPDFIGGKMNNRIGEPSTVMFPKVITEQIGFFSTTLKQALDYEYWYRILTKYNIYLITTPLVYFRLHNNQATEVNSNSGLNERVLWEKIVFQQFYTWLHPTVQTYLKSKYSLPRKVIRWLKAKLN